MATRELVLFLVFFGLLFLLRNARLLFDERLFDLAVYGFLVLFIVFVFVLGHQKKEWKLPSWLNLFTFLNGMLGNFLFLFSSFYVGILYGLEKLPFYMYFSLCCRFDCSKNSRTIDFETFIMVSIGYAIAWTEFFFAGPLDSKWFCDRCLSA